MATLRILVLVPDTPAVVHSAFTMAMAPTTVPNPPPGFVIDPSFAAVPIEPDAAKQQVTVTIAGRVSPSVPGQIGPTSYVVRGLIDENDLDTATQNSLLPDGSPRIFADPEISGLPTCGGDPPVGTALDVKRLLGAGRLIQQKMDGSDVALAIVDTGINLAYLQSKGLRPSLDTHASWSSLPSIVPGQAAVDHGTMCAYDALLSAPNALLLDHAVLSGVTPGGSTMSGVLSNAISSYGKLLQLMTLSPDERHFHSMVVSNSWGMFKQSWDFPPSHPGRYGDNPGHPFNIIVGSLASAGADIVFAAGNCGPTCPDSRCDPPPNLPPIFLANSHSEVLCIAGVDTAGALVGYSSHGPGVLNNQKPDLAAYTHFLGSEAFGRGSPDSGTSAACPVVAGVVAALRSVYAYDPTNSRRRPSNVRGFLTSTATGSGVWQPDLGHGIISTLGFPTAGTVL
jgi:subtilisin family serine protease